MGAKGPPLDPSQSATLARRASARVGDLTGKDERWVMVTVRGGEAMLFGGSDEPCVYMELKSLGLEASEAEALSSGLCRFVVSALGVAAERVYVEMSSPDGALWGWNGSTFA